MELMGLLCAGKGREEGIEIECLLKLLRWK
jgi:hypothetical protein